MHFHLMILAFSASTAIARALPYIEDTEDTVPDFAYGDVEIAGSYSNPQSREDDSWDRLGQWHKPIEGKYFQPNGELGDKKPIIGPRASPGMTWVNPDGSITVVNDDGTISIHTEDGTVVTSDESGPITILKPDGTLRTRNRDGTITTRYLDGRETTAHEDGTVVTKHPDGRITTTHGDGSITTQYPDGHVEAQNSERENNESQPDNFQKAGAAIIGVLGYIVHGLSTGAIKLFKGADAVRKAYCALNGC